MNDRAAAEQDEARHENLTQRYICWANVYVCLPIQVLYSFHLTQCMEKYIHNTYSRECKRKRDRRPKGGLALHLNGEATTSTTMMMVMMLKNYVCSACICLCIYKCF